MTVIKSSNLLRRCESKSPKEISSSTSQRIDVAIQAKCQRERNREEIGRRFVSVMSRTFINSLQVDCFTLTGVQISVFAGKRKWNRSAYRQTPMARLVRSREVGYRLTPRHIVKRRPIQFHFLFAALCTIAHSFPSGWKRTCQEERSCWQHFYNSLVATWLIISHCFAQCQVNAKATLRSLITTRECLRGLVFFAKESLRKIEYLQSIKFLSFDRLQIYHETKSWNLTRFYLTLELSK